MQLKDLVPWSRSRQNGLQRSQESANPLMSLQHEINRAFDDFWSRFERPFDSTHGFLTTAQPRVDISDTDNEVEISVELPGLDEKDIDVTLTDDVLTIRGEKKAEKEEKRSGYYMSERTYGAFHRSIPLPAGVDSSKADARFKKGVLTIQMPKTPEAKSKVRRIEVKPN